MTQEVTTISPLFSTPYITIAEFKQAPTGVDVDDLVGGGSGAVNDQELANVIARACSWIDSHCNQVLASTVDTDSFRARVSRDGFLKVHPRYFPVTEVVSASYGSNPQSMNALDPTTAWIEPMSVIFPMNNLLTTFFGQIQFGNPYSLTSEQFVTITYVNGYPNALLASSSLSGVSTLAVNDLTGFLPNQKFQVYDGATTELLTVSSSFVPAQGAGNLVLASPTSYAHNAGVSVSALPPAVKQAAIFMTASVLKARGNATLVMQTLTPSQFMESNPAAMNDYQAALDLLKPYRRMR